MQESDFRPGNLTMRCLLRQPKQPPKSGTLIYITVKNHGERGPEVWAKCILTSGLLKRYFKDGHFHNYSPHKENKLMKR